MKLNSFLLLIPTLYNSNDDAAYDSQLDNPILELNDRAMPSIKEIMQYKIKEDKEEDKNKDVSVLRVKRIINRI